MCDKLPYENPRIDKCLLTTIAGINMIGWSHENRKHKLSTVASCCGHNRYPSTIVVREIRTGEIFEWFSETPLEKRKKHRYYKRDKDGYYYIDQLQKSMQKELDRELKWLGFPEKKRA